MLDIPDCRWPAWTACLAIALLCAGCMKGDPAPSIVNGTATWREPLPLTAGTTFEATLEDVSRADAPADVLGRTLIESPGAPPIQFSIPYDADRIDPKHRYAVRARVTLGDELLYTTDTHYPVLGTSQLEHADLLLRKVGTAPAGAPAPEPVATASLQDTYWKVMRIGGQAVVVVDFKREPHLILHPADSRVSGSGGCNRLVGSYSLDGDRLSFGQMAGTMMACPEGMEQEQRFHTALADVERWRIMGEALQLFDSGGTVVAEFESRLLK
jgi:putative lipoprotein